MSKFTCEVVPVVLEPHPDADNLSIVKVWGYTVVVRTEEWKYRDRGVYIPPDSVCPNDDRFGFLFNDHMQNSRNPGRVRVRKFRGVISQGMLMPLPATTWARIGVDVAKQWGITHWEPANERAEVEPLKWWERLLRWAVPGRFLSPKLRRQRRGQAANDQPVRGPKGLVVPKYDVENFNRYNKVLDPGTDVYITEKIHGCNARFVWTDDHGLHVGSRTQWKKKHAGNIWWKAVEQNPWITEWCSHNPGRVLYGEVYGQVQDLKYGTEPNQYLFRAFDILNEDGTWLEYTGLIAALPSVHRVPLLFVGPFNEANARLLAEEDSRYANHCREGVVITPVKEMTSRGLGRVQLKMISNRYYARKDT